MALFGRLLGNLPVSPLKRVSSRRDLIRREAQIGGRLFGPVAPGGARQFFYFDKHSWIWYEEWLDNFGQRQSITTRYEIRPTGIVKAQGSQPYHFVEAQEAKNLTVAIKLYYREVMKEVYGQEVNIPITA